MTNISQQVRKFLEAQQPLSIIELKSIYAAVGTDNTAAVRAALYHLAAGSPVSKRTPPSKYYAIYLPIQYSDTQIADLFLTLPGIPRNRILQDVPATNTVEQAITRLKQKYGRETIEYWGYAAQYRTVDQARTGMKKAVKRDGSCRVCAVADKYRQKAGLPPLLIKPVQASHIVSRRAIFWTLLEQIDQEEGCIFTDSSVVLLKQRLKDEPLHSDEQFIIALCSEHDKLLLKSLRTAAM